MNMITKPHSTSPFRVTRRAFTMFELTLVLLILGIAGAIVVPRVGGDLYAGRLRAAANMLASDIEFCQSECISQPNAPRAVIFNTAINNYKIVIFSSSAIIKNPGDGLEYQNDFLTGRSAAFKGVTLSSAVAGGSALSTLTFDAYGRPLITGNLTVTLAYNSQTIRVVVNSATGDVTVE